MAKKTYDVIVIGNGSAGFSAVEAARNSGASVCVIEKEVLGGECPNFACVPSKAILKAAKTYRTVQHARGFGIELGKIGFDFSEVMKYRQKVVDTITGGGEIGDRYRQILEKLKVDVKMGEAVFLDDKTLSVDGELVHGKTIIIATGTVDFVPPITGIDETHFIGWKEAISQKRQPKSMAIIGGGPVGCEIATFYASFGTRVVLFQGAPTILNREDEEIAAIAQDAIGKLGVEVFANAKVTEVIDAQGGVYGVKADVNGEQVTSAVDQIVVAAGKRANVQGLALEEAGVELDQRGNIKTGKDQRTSVKHIFAAGDVVGGMQFTHTAHHRGYVAGHNAALTAQKKRTAPRKVDMRVVPRVTFVEPEVASVGMTATQVKKMHKQVLVGRYQVAALGRAVTENARVGLIKIVAHPKTGKILGGHVIGERAGEVVHEIALAIYLNTTMEKLAGMIRAFPTYSEGISAAAAMAKIE